MTIVKQYIIKHTIKPILYATIITMFATLLLCTINNKERFYIKQATNATIFQWSADSSWTKGAW